MREHQRLFLFIATEEQYLPKIRGIIMLFKLGSRNRLINIDKSAC